MVYFNELQCTIKTSKQSWMRIWNESLGLPPREHIRTTWVVRNKTNLSDASTRRQPSSFSSSWESVSYIHVCLNYSDFKICHSAVYSRLIQKSEDVRSTLASGFLFCFGCLITLNSLNLPQLHVFYLTKKYGPGSYYISHCFYLHCCIHQGGLPAWLLNKKDIVLRSTDAGKNPRKARCSRTISTRGTWTFCTFVLQITSTR